MSAFALTLELGRFSLPKQSRSPYRAAMNDREPVTRRAFPETRWSVVAGLGQESVKPEALAELCQAYWVPIYGFIRARGKSREDAQDLTQGFFSRIVEKELFTVADRERGKMRTFLLGVLKHYLSGEYDKASALKRGGGTTLVEMDFQEAEEHYALSSGSGLDPARRYDQQWALALLAKTLDVLRREYEDNERGELFQKLHPVLTGQSLDGGYETAGQDLGLSANAVTIAVYRLRLRYRTLLCERIDQTVASAEEVDEEIAYLCELFSNPKPSSAS